MNIFWIAVIAATYVIGTLTGVILFMWNTPIFGVLQIDWTDPNKDTYTIEVKDLNGLENTRRVALMVRHIKSQK